MHLPAGPVRTAIQIQREAPGGPASAPTKLAVTIEVHLEVSHGPPHPRGAPVVDAGDLPGGSIVNVRV